MIHTTLTIFLLLLIPPAIYPQIKAPDKADIRIYFDDSAARFVLESPVKALQARDSIWNSFEGYRITRVWHEQSSYPLTWELWERELDRYINIDTSLAGKSLELLYGVTRLEKREHEKITQHLRAYLPGTVSFDAYVSFVAFTMPYAFVVEQNRIGLDITGHEWHFDPECLLNTVIHELYHVGYRLNTPDKAILDSDPRTGDEFVRFNYAYAFKEGMATHVACKALDLYPSEFKHDDYKLMEKEENIKNAISGVNQLLELSRTAPTDTVNAKIWEIGILRRAYYLAGAHMCRVIEDKYGTEYLCDMVSKGSSHWIKEYNALVPKDFKINTMEL